MRTPVAVQGDPSPTGRLTVRISHLVVIPVRRRSVIVAACIVTALFVIAVLTLTLGRLGLSWDSLLPALFGDATGKEAFVLNRLRGPRLVVAVLAGAAFGVSGALFQTVTRNPLGSPDVVGIQSGAGAGAAAFALLLPGAIPVPLGAILGALVAVGAVFAATGRGFSSPSRFIIVGIGVSAMSFSFTQYVIASTSREQATVIAAYLNGSTASRSWGDALLIAIAFAVLLPLTLLLARRLQLIELGDEMADALGSRASATRVMAIMLGIALATAAVTVVGPVAFVALAAPQIARRVSRSNGPGILLAALMGAFVLAFSDLLVQHAPLGASLPVGIFTACVGGVYLGYLLVSEWKKGTV